MFRLLLPYVSTGDLAPTLAKMVAGIRDMETRVAMECDLEKALQARTAPVTGGALQSAPHSHRPGRSRAGGFGLFSKTH